MVDHPPTKLVCSQVLCCIGCMFVVVWVFGSVHVSVRQISLNAPIQSMQASTSNYVEPTMRSRTLLFLSYRDSSSTRIRRRPRVRPKSPSYYPDAPHYAESSSERQGLINGIENIAGHTTIDMDGLPPKWCINLFIRCRFFLEASLSSLS